MEIYTCQGKFQQLPSLMGEKLASLNTILPVQHGCNPNDQEILHEFKLLTAFF